MKKQTCKKALHKLSPLTFKEIMGVKRKDGTIDRSTIIGKMGDEVCTKCGKVFRREKQSLIRKFNAVDLIRYHKFASEKQNKENKPFELVRLYIDKYPELSEKEQLENLFKGLNYIGL